MSPRRSEHFGKPLGVVRSWAWLIVAFALSGCSGGGGGPASAGSAQPTIVQKVSGTIDIVSSPATTALARAALARHGAKPLFISASTGDVHLYIDAATAASGSLTTCAAATGAGTGCTISWTTALAVPASHVFTVEIDTGTTHTPNNTVLAEGEGSYVIVAGVNTLTALSLNAAVSNATFTTTSCTTTACVGTVTLAAPGGNAIAYTGAVTPPAYGQSPTSGNVYDNSGVAGASNVTLTSNTPAIGTITGTAQTPFSTYAAGTLTLAGVNTTGSYTYAVACVAAATGTFGITIGGAATPSLDVTAAELAALTPAVAYPAAGVTTNPTAPSYTCTAGNISSATGTLPVN